MPLTDTAIRALKTPELKPKRYSDERGLYLEVSPSGAKLWRFKYRWPGRGEQRLALGQYPDVSLRDARDAREEARKQIAAGVDPGAVKRAKKMAAGDRLANSFEVVGREYVAKKSKSLEPGYADETLRRLENNLFPPLGKFALSEITAPQLLSALRKVEDRGAVETAHRLLQLAGQIFRYGISTSRCERDVAADLRGALQAVNVRHHAAITEPDDLGKLLRHIDAYRGTAVVRAALKLAPLVFARPGELRKAKKADINLETAEWRYIASKTKQEHLVPLSTQAVAILRELRPFTEGSPYEFPGARSRTKPMSESAILAALRDMGYTNEQMTGHGFRAAARTIMDEVLGERVDLIEHQLAHRVKDPNGRAYNRTKFLADRREMMQRWADYCDELKTKGGTLLQMSRGA